MLDWVEHTECTERTTNPKLTPPLKTCIKIEQPKLDRKFLTEKILRPTGLKWHSMLCLVISI